MQQRRSGKRKPRTNFDEKDKLIFLNIIRNSEGGRFATVITVDYPAYALLCQKISRVYGRKDSLF